MSLYRGRKRKGACSTHGVLLLDKPIGLSSNEVLQQVKRLFNGAKAGHTGSLDLLAEGLLPIFFGEATKLTQFLLEADKHYQVTAQLGIKTTTGDSEGQIIARKPVEAFTKEAIESQIVGFLGDQHQVPSMYSAIKFQGKPLYTYARAGKNINRAPRIITIHDLKLLSLDLPFVTFYVHSSKGTYIRTLVEDIGSVLGCEAHVRSLRRTQVAHAHVAQSVTLRELECLYNDNRIGELRNYLQPMDALLAHWPGMIISPDHRFYLKQGQSIPLSPGDPVEGWVRLLDKKENCIGVGEIVEGRIAPRRLLTPI